MEFNLVDLFEAAVDAFPEREYLVAGDGRRTYAQIEERANRLAHHLHANGVKPGDHVGIYAYNSVEWVEALWAIFKIRAVWININYRYVEEELAYLFDNADLVALIYQREFAPRVGAVRPQLPLLQHAIVIDDGSDPLDTIGAVDYEQAVASGAPERDFPPRSGDDRYILFTGGTTGMPKGVVWRHEDVFFALGGGIDAMTKERVTRPEQMVEKGKAGFPVTLLPIAPLMHGATQWSVMSQSFTGNKVVLVAKFDPDQVWRLIGDEKVNAVMITGDAMARPLVEALQQPGGNYDTSSLLAISSTAALFSPSLKDDLFRLLPNVLISEAIGSSESGNNGLVRLEPGHTAMKGGPTVSPQPGTVVLDEDLKPIPPGTDKIGKVARVGDIPIGYYKDAAKTAETFVTSADGVRYSMPGDYATVEADGSITLLGRGSVSINSGGEKIYPEEVEAAIKSHPAVWDATVIGIPDERWGQRVAAVVEPREGAALTLEDLQAHCRTKIAGYKVPRQLTLVTSVVRSPSGKPDYRWAASVAGTATD
ncbi:MAG TPA: acyl-CoA synthetase [Acidimicrobiales bacterium]|nr:acyl-CoA synthetase [Acidimicrobiales bacterium]